ncbi:unnamed protein product [Dovyalis caffra]|uniref:Uncharacterized protein n=1 Tax=Dovyalis caffra TaxID=77055 RepID=A0AAV1SHL0_9ROSI|nr:unnamed protein product [Dovyalis caffra]
MKPSKTTSLEGQPNSFAKLFAAPAVSSSRSRASGNEHESIITDGEAISNASKSSRPGGNPLHKAPSGVPSSSLREISRGGEEPELTASTEIQHHKTREEKVKTLKKLSKQEPTSEIAVKIAFLVESLNDSNHITEEIIKKCKEGEQKLEDGLLLVKQAQQRLDLLLTEISD